MAFVNAISGQSVNERASPKTPAEVELFHRSFWLITEEHRAALISLMTPLSWLPYSGIFKIKNFSLIGGYAYWEYFSSEGVYYPQRGKFAFYLNFVYSWIRVDAK